MNKVYAVKEEKKVKKPKVERPPSAYILFSSSKMEEMKKNKPNMTIAELSKAISPMWKEASEKEKEPFYAEHNRIKEEMKAGTYVKKVKEPKEPKGKKEAAKSTSAKKTK